MKKQILLGLALASWWTSLLLGQSPPPPPTPTEHGEKKQDVSGIKNSQSQPAYSPSPTASATLHQSTSTPTQSSADKKTNASYDPPAINWALILGVANTVLLLLFNGILAAVAVYQYRLTHKQAEFTEKGLAETKRAADAANTSAQAATKAVEHSERALRLTECAVVLLCNVEGHRWAHRGTLDASTIVCFTLKNFGRTKACNVAFKGRLEVTGGKSDELPQSASCTLAPGGKNFWNSRSFGLWLDNNILHDINEGRAKLSYSAELIYWDVFEEQHSQEVVGDWVTGLQDFSFAADKST